MSETLTGPDTAGLPGWTTGTWTIDPAHSTVGFVVRHLMSKVRGKFDEFGGEIVTEADPARSTVTASVALTSVNTGVEMRDNHLRSADFFNVAETPTMSFTGTGLRQDGDDWVLAGDLTIRDTTRTVELKVGYLGVDPTGMQGEPRIGFEASTTISRKDFGVSFGLAVDGSKVVVADKVEVVLDVEAYRAS
jgi:polyisoprenoid-binding protein YceI